MSNVTIVAIVELRKNRCVFFGECSCRLFSRQMREDDRHEYFLLGKMKATMSSQGFGKSGIHPAFNQICGIGTSWIIEVGEEVRNGSPYDSAHAPYLFVDIATPLILLVEHFFKPFLPNRMEHEPSCLVVVGFHVLQPVHDFQDLPSRFLLWVPGKILDDKLHHMEMAPLESGLRPVPLHKARHAFLAVSHHNLGWLAADEDPVPGAVVLTLRKLPEYVVVLIHGNQCTELAPMDEFRIHDEDIRLVAERYGAIRILFEKLPELIRKRLTREAIPFRNLRLAVRAREPSDETLIFMAQAHVIPLDRRCFPAGRTEVPFRPCFRNPMPPHPATAHLAYFVMFSHPDIQPFVYPKVNAIERARYFLAFSIVLAP